MVGVLVLDEAGGQHDPRPHPTDHAREPDRVGGADFQMGVAVELDELERRAEDGGGLLGLERPTLGGAVRPGLAPRADDQVRRPAASGLGDDDPAASELDVVGMGAECQERRAFRWGGRHRLHRTDRSRRGRHR